MDKRPFGVFTLEFWSSQAWIGWIQSFSLVCLSKCLYDELRSLWGDWFQDQNLGYVWLPYAPEQGFHPYGRMARAMTFLWQYLGFLTTIAGWAPFHYGRWYFDILLPKWGLGSWLWSGGPALGNWRNWCCGYYVGFLWLPGSSLNVGYLPSSYFVIYP